MREKSGVEVNIQFGDIQEGFFEEINQTEVWMTGENHHEKDMEGSGRVLGDGLQVGKSLVPSRV